MKSTSKKKKSSKQALCLQKARVNNSKSSSCFTKNASKCGTGKPNDATQMETAWELVLLFKGHFTNRKKAITMMCIQCKKHIRNVSLIEISIYFQNKTVYLKTLNKVFHVMTQSYLVQSNPPQNWQLCTINVIKRIENLFFAICN